MIVVILLLSFCTSLSAEVGLEKEWTLWKMEYKRSYSDKQEELERYAIWQANRRYIEEHNRHADIFGFTLKMNHFGDMTSTEFFENTNSLVHEKEYHFESKKHDCKKKKDDDDDDKKGKGKHHHHHHHHHHDNNNSDHHHGNKGKDNKMHHHVNETTGDVSGHMLWSAREGYFHLPKTFNKSSLPKSVDWRTLGVVTPVKDQGFCHSSYAFSITGAIEGAYALATDKLEPLSEQNIIDCSVLYGNKGCSGGNREATIMYILDNGGIDTAKSYPYTGSQEMCKFNHNNIGATVSGFVRIKRGKERDLQAALAMVGPVTIAIDHRHAAFRFYSYGVFDVRSCSTNKLSHAMLLVGYGQQNGKDHWVIKNSWGHGWGVKGYMMMARNGHNQCGVATRALFPKL